MFGGLVAGARNEGIGLLVGANLDGFRARRKGAHDGYRPMLILLVPTLHCFGRGLVIGRKSFEIVQRFGPRPYAKELRGRVSELVDLSAGGCPRGVVEQMRAARTNIVSSVAGRGVKAMPSRRLHH